MKILFDTGYAYYNPNPNTNSNKNFNKNQFSNQGANKNNFKYPNKNQLNNYGNQDTIYNSRGIYNQNPNAFNHSQNPSSSQTYNRNQTDSDRPVPMEIGNFQEDPLTASRT